MAAYLGATHSTGCHSRSPDYIPGLCEVVVGDLKLSLPRVAERGSKKKCHTGNLPYTISKVSSCETLKKLVRESETTSRSKLLEIFTARGDRALEIHMQHLPSYETKISKLTVQVRVLFLLPLTRNQFDSCAAILLARLPPLHANFGSFCSTTFLACSTFP